MPRLLTNDYYCNNLTVGTSLRVTLVFPAAYMPRPSNMRKLALIFNGVFVKIMNYLGTSPVHNFLQLLAVPIASKFSS